MLNKNSLKSNDKIFIILIMLMGVLITSIVTLSLSVSIIQNMLALITIILIINKKSKNSKIYAIIYIVAIIAIILFYYGSKMKYGTPYFSGGSDDLSYEKDGFQLFLANIYSPKKALESGIISSYHNSSFFVVYLSILNKWSNVMGGYSTFIPRILNVYFLMWACLIFEYLLGKYTRFTDLKINLSIIIFATTPNILYINSFVFRDTLNLLQILLIIYLFDKILDKNINLRKIIYSMLLIFIIYITYYTRKNSLIFAAAICFITFMKKFEIKKVFLIVPIILVLFMNNLIEITGFQHYNEIYTEYIVNNTGTGLSKYIFQKPLFPMGIIFRSMYAFISPFPNFFDLFKSSNAVVLDFAMFLVYCGVVCQILFITFSIKRIFKIEWLSFVFLVTFCGVIITTFTFRHIILYYPFLVALGVDGFLSSSKKNRNLILFSNAFIGGILMCGYVLLKF